MANQSKASLNKGQIAAFGPRHAVEVLPPNSEIVGRFIAETENICNARAMRISGLLRRINESGQRTEVLLRTAAERMEAAEAALKQQFRKGGLTLMKDDGTGVEEVAQMLSGRGVLILHRLADGSALTLQLDCPGDGAGWLMTHDGAKPHQGRFSSATPGTKMLVQVIGPARWVMRYEGDDVV